MKHPITIRIAGLAVVIAVVASACASAGTSSPDRTTFDPTPPSTAAQSTTAQPARATTQTTEQPAPATTQTREPPPPPTQPPTVDLVTASIEDLGITTVVPKDWGRAGAGEFIGEDAMLGFHATPSWAAPDPIDVGYGPPDRVELGGKVWQLYDAEVNGMVQFLATTAVGADTYLVWLGVPLQQADHYLDAVGIPVLEAFEVDAAAPTGNEIMRQTVTIEGRTAAYATGGAGGPTVVFEAGFGDWMPAWHLVAPAIAESSSVFLYDRPGYGGSDPATTPRDAATMVVELRELLAATGHEPPYVLVGHSLGGTVMDLFARTHPDEVAGLVLVDSRHHEFRALCVAVLGEVPECVAGVEEGLAPHMAAEWRALSTTEQQLAAAPDLAADLNLVVITAGLRDEYSSEVGMEVWQETQRDYASLVPGARHIVAEHSTHGIPLEQPDVIVDAIAGLLDG